jgi:tetratricopeptide (TPR) repeat protein
VFVATALSLTFAAWAAVDWYRTVPPTALRQATYVGRASCIECHQQQAAAYAGSDHDRAMEVATDDTVLGDFNNAVFTRYDETTRFFRDGKKFMVNAEGPDGQYHDYEILWTFGVRPLQQYMVQFPDGRVQVLRVSWDVNKKQWFYVAPPDAEDLRLRPDDPLHWTGLAQNWNSMCAECHSTDYHKNYDLATNTYKSDFKEIDVSCEACHGPGSVHVELARGKSLFWDRHVGFGLTNVMKNAPNVRQIETCAPCHARRSMIHPDYRAGDALYDHFDPARLFVGLYHADGQIKDEVYEFGSFTQSKMYHQNVKCSDCHDPHSLKLKFPGNRLCAQCHQPGKYDGAGHTHHAGSAPDAPETQCVTCHMPTTTYMEIDARRDHAIRVPRPDLTVEIGTPNVCNRCHTKPEEDAAWAAEAVKKWYGPKRPDDPHYARAIWAAEQGKPEGDSLLREVLGRPTSPDIVRSTAVGLLAGYPSAESRRARRQALDDPSPLVRASAVQSLDADSPAALLEQAQPLLEDPVRAVRMAAASRLIVAAPELAQSQFRRSLMKALAEYRAGQELQLDRVEANLSLASLAEILGDIPGAIQSFRDAIRVEPYRAGARAELARLLQAVETDPALASLRDTIKVDPDEIITLRAQEVDLLARDEELLPGDPRPHYSRGWLLYLLGRVDDAREEMEATVRLAPEDYNGWMALALICEKQQRWEDAAGAVIQMAKLRPQAEEWQGLRLRLREEIRAWQAEQAAEEPHSESLSPEQALEPAGDDNAPGEIDDAPSAESATPPESATEGG